jgi:hypothetical protein
MTEIQSITLATLQTMAIRLSHAVQTAHAAQPTQWRAGYHRALTDLLEAAYGIRETPEPKPSP